MGRRGLQGAINSSLQGLQVGRDGFIGTPGRIGRHKVIDQNLPVWLQGDGCEDHVSPNRVNHAKKIEVKEVCLLPVNPRGNGTAVTENRPYFDQHVSLLKSLARQMTLQSLID